MASERLNSFFEKIPKSQAFIDFAGAERRFSYSGWEQGVGGYTVVAREVVTGGSKDSGYEFSSHSYSSPEEAFTALVNKIRTALTVRHLDPSSSEPALLAARAVGRIGSGGVVIDGVFIDWSAFAKLAQNYEGWEFELVFSS